VGEPGQATALRASTERFQGEELVVRLDRIAFARDKELREVWIHWASPTRPTVTNAAGSTSGCYPSGG